MTVELSAHRTKLTTAVLARKLVPPSSNKPTTIYDTEVPGFGAYRTSERPGSFFILYRINRRQRKSVIGRINEISVHDARSEAARIKLAARREEDLVHTRKVELERGKTLGEAYADYLQSLDRKGASASTLRGYESNWKLSLSAEAHRSLSTITKTDARKWHAHWGKRGKTVANHTARLLRAIYNHALRTTDGLPPNPCVAIDFFTEEKARPKLEWDILPAWLCDVERLENPIRRCFWPFLLYSGLRSSDARSIRWDEIDGSWLHRPNPKGGRHFAFNSPLSGNLQRLLDQAREAHGALYPSSPFVFAADSAKGFIEAPREKTIPYVSPHMLRRTFATACVEAGLDPYTTKQLLNHRTTTGDVTALYVQPSKGYLLESIGAVKSILRLNLLLDDH